MKKKLLKALPILPAALFILLYGSGYCAQFIRNYTVWKNSGGYPGDGTSPPFPSAGIGDCFRAVFQFPYGIYGLLICILLLGILAVMVMKLGFGERGEMDRERNLIYSDKGTYGTAGFMTQREMEGVLDIVSDVRKTDGIILGEVDGKILALPRESRMNRNIAVYGASGSMKSRTFCRNAIFQSVKRGDSIICTDPKSELYEDMSHYLRDNGYVVRVFNLVDPEHSDSWNCLKEIGGDEIMAQIFADTVIKNTGSAKGDHFWDASEMNLLKALVLYVERGYPEESKNIGEAYKLLTFKSEKELDALFDLLPLSHPAKAPYQIFRQAADSVRSGILIGLGSRLQVFQSELIRQITSYDEINLTLPGHERCAYFCVISDQTATFDFLSSLFFSFLFIKLVRYADQNFEGGKLPVAVNIIGDEWPNIGTVPDFCKKISTIRSRNIHMTGVIFQSVAQLQNRYPQNQWQEILGSCDTQLFLGATDEITAKLVSDRTGEVSVNVSSKAKMLGTWRISDYTPEYRETHSVGKRKLLTPDEVLRLPIQQALVILRGQKVLKVNKFDYTRHPEAKKLRPAKASEHIPDWHRFRKAPEPKVVPKSPVMFDTECCMAKAPSAAIPTDKNSILS